MSKKKLWTNEKLNDLRSLLGSMPLEMIAIKLGVTTGAAHAQCIRNKWSYAYKRSVRNWSKEEDVFLKDNVQTMSHKKIAEHLNRKIASISNRVATLNLCGFKLKDLSVLNGYDEEDLDLCRQLYSSGVGVREISRKMEIRPGVIAVLINEMS